MTKFKKVKLLNSKELSWVFKFFRDATATATATTDATTTATTDATAGTARETWILKSFCRNA